MSSSNKTPINWEGLLKWSLKYSDGTHDVVSMSDERKKYLESAVEEYLKNAKNSCQLIAEYANYIKTDPDDCIVLNSLDNISSVVDQDPEVARTIITCPEVLQTLIDILDRPNLEIVVSALCIHANWLHNNSILQDAMYNAKLLDHLIRFLDHERTDSEFKNVQLKAMSTLGALMSGNSNLCKLFIENYHGVKHVGKGLMNDDIKIQLKSCLVLQNLLTCESISMQQIYNNQKNDIVDADLKSDIETIIQGVIKVLDRRDFRDTDIEFGEIALEAILVLLQQTRIAICRFGYMDHIKNSIANRLHWIEERSERKNELKNQMSLLRQILKLMSLPYSVDKWKTYKLN